MWSNYILLAFVLLTLMTLSSSKSPVSPLNQGENGKTTQPSEEQGGARDHMPKWWAWLEVGEEPSGHWCRPHGQVRSKTQVRCRSSAKSPKGSLWLVASQWWVSRQNRERGIAQNSTTKGTDLGLKWLNDGLSWHLWKNPMIHPSGICNNQFGS